MQFTFGPFTFDGTTARLSRDNAEVRLRPQALQVLRVLLQHGGRPIGYDQMIAEGWHGTFVSRHTVDVTVGEVKKVLGEYGRWIVHRPKVGYSLVIPTSDELVRKGWHFASRRTKEGAERAIECFQQAATQCPGDFRAFEGLSTCYLMQATFGICAPIEVYPRFLEAHTHAVEQGTLTPELRCNRAHGLHMFEHRPHDAEGEFLRALTDKPAFATVHVRMALMCATLGQLDRALELVTQGYKADPLLPTLPPAEVNVRVWRREYDTAVEIGRKAVELHPYLQISRANYAQALEFSGCLEEALEQYQLGSIMSGDLPWMRALEGTCLAKLGRTPRLTPFSTSSSIVVMRTMRTRCTWPSCAMRSVSGRRHSRKSSAPSTKTRHSSTPSTSIPRWITFRDDRRFARLQDSIRIKGCTQ